MARRPLPVSSKDELKMQKAQSQHHVTKASERSKWGITLEDLDSFSNDIASYASTAMTESVDTETSIYTSTSAFAVSAAAEAAAPPLHPDAVVERPLPSPTRKREHYAQLPNADTGSEKICNQEFRVAETPKEYQVEDRECNDERGNDVYYDGETEDYFSDEEDYVYESLLDETEFEQGLCGYVEGFEPPIIHDISPAYSARRKFSDEQIPSSIMEDENNMSSSKHSNMDNLICANCGGRADGCGGGQFCC